MEFRANRIAPTPRKGHDSRGYGKARSKWYNYTCLLIFNKLLFHRFKTFKRFRYPTYFKILNNENETIHYYIDLPAYFIKKYNIYVSCLTPNVQNLFLYKTY